MWETDDNSLRHFHTKTTYKAKNNKQKHIKKATKIKKGRNGAKTLFQYSQVLEYELLVLYSYSQGQNSYSTPTRHSEKSNTPYSTPTRTMVRAGGAKLEFCPTLL